jgi:hypothetical protein
MDKIMRTSSAAALVLMSLFCHAQENVGISQAGRNTLTLNGLRYATYASVGYSYALWQNTGNNFRLGLQTAIGFGGNNAELSIPLGLFFEYGKRHRIGADANIIFQYWTHPYPNPAGNSDLKVVYTNGAFTSSLYYSYNFGEKMRYFVGAGANYKGYFGSNYGVEYQVPDEFAPFIFFGVRF